MLIYTPKLLKCAKWSNKIINFSRYLTAKIFITLLYYGGIHWTPNPFFSSAGSKMGFRWWSISCSLFSVQFTLSFIKLPVLENSHCLKLVPVCVLENAFSENFSFQVKYCEIKSSGQNKLWNLFKVSDVILVFSLLILNWSQKFFWFFHFWLWITKCRLRHLLRALFT